MLKCAGKSIYSSKIQPPDEFTLSEISQQHIICKFIFNPAAENERFAALTDRTIS